MLKYFEVNTSNCGIALPDSPSYATSSTKAIEIITGGFAIFSASYINTNNSSYKYNYIAWR